MIVIKLLTDRTGSMEWIHLAVGQWRAPLNMLQSLGFHAVFCIPWLAKETTISREGLCSVEFVLWLVTYVVATFKTHINFCWINARICEFFIILMQWIKFTTHWENTRKTEGKGMMLEPLFPVLEWDKLWYWNGYYILCGFVVNFVRSKRDSVTFINNLLFIVTLSVI